MEKNIAAQLAKHLRGVYFGGNWTWVNLKDSLQGVSWQQAIAQVNSLNTIAALVYHTGYYVAAQLEVLRGGTLTAHDKYAFAHPPISSQADWEQSMDTNFKNAAALAGLIEQLPESKLWEIFVEEKYGTYYRNIQGVIEHTHYHLGQIVLLKKMLGENREESGHESGR